MVELIWDKEQSGIATAATGASITVGERSDFSPEDLMATAAAGCVMREFLARAEAAAVPILSYASASYVDAAPGDDRARVIIRCYIVISEDGRPAEIRTILRESIDASPLCRLLGDAIECRADIRALCGTCAQ